MRCLLTILPLFLAVGHCKVGLGERQTASSASNPSSTSSVFVVPTASSAPSINSTYYDLSQHFCRIYRHASVFADGKIYIDGGNTYIPRGNTTFSNTPPSGWTKGMNNNLLVLDLSKNFTNQDTFPYKALNKGPDVPSSLIEHTLWYSAATRKIYQLGGWFSFNNVNDPGFKNLSAIPPSAIWEFDIDTQVWSIVDDFVYVNTGNKVERPGAAANCNAPSINMSFIFEGYVQQRSDQAYINFTQSSDFKFLEGMLALDTSNSVTKPTLTNVSVPLQLNGQNFGPRMNGASVHIPIGKKGIIVQIGGQMTMNPTAYGIQIKNANAGNTNLPLKFVDIYDIETGFWFRQETFGLADGIPTGRSDICTVMIPAKDNSSFNVYMVAGVENYATYLTVEEIWVLTIPTFQWTLIHTRADGMYGHTCHAVGENLVIVGGMQTKSDGGDVNTCATHMPAEIFSLATQNYTGVFDVEGAKRPAPVPAKVVAAIGGTTEGGAYVKSPRVWSDLYLQYIFDPTLARPAYSPTYVLANTTGSNATGSNTTGSNDTPTAPPAQDPSSEPNRNVIIGGAVGGTLGALLIACIMAFALIHWRRRKQERINRQSAISHTSELPAYTKHDTGMSYYGGIPAVSAPVAAQAEPVELGGGGGPDDISHFPLPNSQYHQYMAGEIGSPPPTEISQPYTVSDHRVSPMPEAAQPYSPDSEGSSAQHLQARYPSPEFPQRSISPNSQDDYDETTYQDLVSPR